MLKSIFKHKAALTCLLLFCIGIGSALSSLNSQHDAFLYFRKGAIFLLLPLLLVQVRRNCTYAYNALLISLLVAIFYSAMKLSDTSVGVWNGERIDSFWDLGRWGEMLGYMIAVLVPLLFDDSQTKRTFYRNLGILIACILFLLLSGGRGPLIAVLLSTSLYLVYKKPKAFFVIAIISALTLSLGKGIPQVKVVSERISSITELSHDPSNSARIEMWKQGANFTYQNASIAPQQFLFGAGLSSFELSYTRYLKQNVDLEVIIKNTENQFSFNDLHNTYLDLAAKLGVVYAAIYLVLLAMVLRYFVRLCRNEETPWAYSGLCLTLTYFVNSMFYTSGLEYQTTVFFAMLVLCLSQHSLYINQRIN
ncbi:O-antigen ligase family protein [Vibrio coralliilyticus]|uniref:O-antigen ligase family protein n=1 Tax=Vibrio coralliilyticus TaxID=190893 RepID=UPI00148D986D|nr:O-antigen ligase family protein [Vibrio coralliilyticus]WFB48039.1 O-antigen ligase family protein [Vibrio coralliilyticus]